MNSLFAPAVDLTLHLRFPANFATNDKLFTGVLGFLAGHAVPALARVHFVKPEKSDASQAQINTVIHARNLGPAGICLNQAGTSK